MNRIRKYIYLIIILILSLPVYVFAQDDAEDEPEGKKELSLNISYASINDTLKEVQVKLATFAMLESPDAKKKKRWIPVKDVIVNLYLGEVSREGMMGSVATDNDGIAKFPLVNKFNAFNDTSNHFKFIARVMEDMVYEDIESEIEITESRIELTSYEEDSLKYLKAIVVRADESGEFIPATETEIRFYVKRDFGLLPLTDGNLSTDESGEVILELPFTVPGDEKGGMIFVARIEDNEELGMVASYLNSNWGVPTVVSSNRQRALWASRANAPIWAILSINAVLVGIWISIFYVIFQLYKIKLSGKQNF